MPGVNASRSAERPAGLPGADPPRGSCIDRLMRQPFAAVLAAGGRGHPFVAGRILRTAAGSQRQLSTAACECYHARALNRKRPGPQLERFGYRVACGLANDLVMWRRFPAAALRGVERREAPRADRR